MFRKLTIIVVILVGLGGAAYFGGVTKTQVVNAVESLNPNHSSTEPSPPPGKADLHLSVEPWDHKILVTAEERQAIGMRLALVQGQSKPIRLELTGRTAYDPNTLVKIRPRFDTLVTKVHASLGQTVKAKDPLVELYSSDLAKAKNDYQEKYIQWQHDLRLLNVERGLVQSGAISKQKWADTQNDEQKSRLDEALARDQLQVFEVPKEEIDRLLVKLGDAPAKDEALKNEPFGKVSEKAAMTLFSKTDGIVIEREVVPGNLYQVTDVLLVIAPLDHLWVWVNVYELDQDKVRVGQTLEIEFPYLEQTIRGTVQYVANEVSKDTRAVKIRASIPNPEARLKSDMLVKANLDIPPLPGQTVIPRLAMVPLNGVNFVFVRTTGDPDKFERRKIELVQEDSHTVVVSKGIKPGEEIVTNGSLILAQLYEDKDTVETGLTPE